MKKLVAISIAVSLALGISVLAYAADSIDPLEDTKSINITLELADIFGMQIWPLKDGKTDYDQDITVEPAVVHIGASTNHNKGWYITAESYGLALMGESPTISVMAYSMAPMEGSGTPEDPAVPIPGAGEGTYDAQVEGGVRLSAPTTIYTSAGTEDVVTYCRIDCMLFANPEDRALAPSGSYTGTVVLTMAE